MEIEEQSANNLMRQSLIDENTVNEVKKPLSFWDSLRKNRFLVGEIVVSCIGVVIAFAVAFNYFRDQTTTVIVPATQADNCYSYNHLYSLTPQIEDYLSDWIIFAVPTPTGYNWTAAMLDASWKTCSYTSTEQFKFRSYGESQGESIRMPLSGSNNTGPVNMHRTLQFKASDVLVVATDDVALEDDGFYYEVMDGSCFFLSCGFASVGAVPVSSLPQFVSPDAVEYIGKGDTAYLYATMRGAEGPSISGKCSVNIYGYTYDYFTQTTTIIKSSDVQCTLKTSVVNAMSLALVYSLTTFSALRLVFYFAEKGYILKVNSRGN